MNLVKVMIIVGVSNCMMASAFADDKGPRSSNGEFLGTVLRSAMAEHKLAKMASNHSSNDGIKLLANRVIKDQEHRINSIRCLSFRKGIKLPQDIDTEQQAQIDRLNQLGDNDFDVAFVDQILNDDTAILAYMNNEKACTDTDVRNFATSAIPEVDHHMRMAEAIGERVSELRHRRGTKLKQSSG